MAESKHTPGPWVAEGSDVVGFGAPVIASGPGSHVAWLTRGLPGDGWPDARLIAAAPDLLAALKGASSALRATGLSLAMRLPYASEQLLRLAAEADAAISKAEGR